MRSLWTLGGLSFPELLRRTVKETWDDSVFGQGGRMAFYQFLALFPTLLVFLAISAGVPDVGQQVTYTIRDLSSQVLPDQVARLLEDMMQELAVHTLSGLRLAAVCAGALWAALNATWAVVYGLNRAYEVPERRSILNLTATITGLTVTLSFVAAIAMWLIFFGSYVEAYFHRTGVWIRVLEWVVLSGTLMLAFAVLYRFAPNLPRDRWQWSTPGAFCALILWIAAALGARFYFTHVDYSSSYGHLNSVVILLLWLYLSNGAILIGGEMNSEIEKAALGRD